MQHDQHQFPATNPDESMFQQLKRMDAQRQGFPGEHWLALGAGLLLLSRAGKSRSMLGRLAGRAAGAALIGRAASGREGLAKQIASFVR